MWQSRVHKKIETQQSDATEGEVACGSRKFSRNLPSVSAHEVLDTEVPAGSSAFSKDASLGASNVEKPIKTKIRQDKEELMELKTVMLKEQLKVHGCDDEMRQVFNSVKDEATLKCLVEYLHLKRPGLLKSLEMIMNIGVKEKINLLEMFNVEPNASLKQDNLLQILEINDLPKPSYPKNNIPIHFKNNEILQPTQAQKSNPPAKSQENEEPSLLQTKKKSMRRGKIVDETNDEEVMKWLQRYQKVKIKRQIERAQDYPFTKQELDKLISSLDATYHLLGKLEKQMGQLGLGCKFCNKEKK